MKKADLKSTAEELNTKLGLDPAIDPSSKQVVTQIKEAAALVEPTDFVKGDEEDEPLSDTVNEVLAEIVADNVEYYSELKEAESILANFKEMGWLKEKEAEEEEEEEEMELLDLVDDAVSLKALKDLAKSYDEFKPIRNGLTAFKTSDALREVMVDILNGDYEEETPKTKKPETKKPETKKPETKKPETKKPAAEKSTKSAYSRIDSVCDVLNGKSIPKTISALVDLADAKYVKNGGTTNIKESRTVTNYVIKVCAHFNIAVPQK